jgi:recombination endonuclease VII
VKYDKERYATDPAYRSRLKAATRAWEQANPAKVRVRYRASHLRRYGITTADYDAMVARQDGLCAVCRRRPIKRLCVDHSHDTKLLRSLLCQGCNRGLGHFEDNPDFLRAGADYLEIWRIIHARRLTAGFKPTPIRTYKPKKRKDTKCLPISPPIKNPKPCD